MPHAPSFSFSSSFDSGNGELVSAEGGAVKVRIRPDPLTEKEGTHHMQWFHFKLSGLKGVKCEVSIVNAGDCSYTDGWDGEGLAYRCCYSHDLVTWRRVGDTSYEGGALVMRHTPEADATYYAYFAPYSQERLNAFVARCGGSPLASTRVLGKTLDGADLDCVTVGTPGPGKRVLWVVARQHPGESMASWWVEGFLGRMLDPADPLARRVREGAVLHCVPNMNPDGSRRGHLRTNACGANLNREWAEPSVESSPEVFYARGEMDRTGCDLALDVHGDEALPHNFLAGGEGVPNWGPRLERLQKSFADAYERASPDFQQEKGYGVDEPGQANMTVCSNALQGRFDCVAGTLEMPFKDNLHAQDEELGWSPERCARLGAACVDAIAAVLPDLR